MDAAIEMISSSLLIREALAFVASTAKSTLDRLYYVALYWVMVSSTSSGITQRPVFTSRFSLIEVFDISDIYLLAELKLSMGWSVS